VRLAANDLSTSLYADVADDQRELVYQTLSPTTELLFLLLLLLLLFLLLFFFFSYLCYCYSLLIIYTVTPSLPLIPEI